MEDRGHNNKRRGGNVFHFINPLKLFNVIFIISASSLLLFPCLLLANTGVFLGSGNQIIPLKNNDIQLKNETVYFSFEASPDSAKWDIPFIPKVKVEANFELANETDKKLAPQLGFPFLDLQGFGDEKEVLGGMNFVVESDEKLQKTTLKEGMIEKKLDPQGLFKKVFTWTETFNPNQTKKLKVSYALDMSIGVHQQVLKYTEDLYGITYFFSYITKTAYTWRLPVEKAVFVADISAISKILSDPDVVKAFLPAKDSTISRPLMTLVCSPFAQREGDIFTWVYKEKIPMEGLTISLNILAIPVKFAELEDFLEEKQKNKDKDSYLKFLQALLQEYKDENNFLLFEEDAKELPEIRKALEKEIGILESSLL